MMLSAEIHCDGCEKDITNTHDSADFRLVLEAEHMAAFPGRDLAMLKLTAPFNHKHHFCNLGCLNYWLNKNK